MFEAIYRLGLGNIVAAVVGFLTLLVAHFLALDGDTFTVLQAVLDTQFWLATHVVCITLGLRDDVRRRAVRRAVRPAGPRLRRARRRTTARSWRG